MTSVMSHGQIWIFEKYQETANDYINECIMKILLLSRICFCLRAFRYTLLITSFILDSNRFVVCIKCRGVVMTFQVKGPGD